MEIDVRGKKVVLRDRIPAREGWPLRDLVLRGAQGERLSFDEEAQALSYMVESWEFDGDPREAESYAGLDLAEFLTLAREAAKNFREILTGPAKN